MDKHPSNQNANQQPKYRAYQYFFNHWMDWKELENLEFSNYIDDI